jgi:hypothetical protein
LNNLNLIDVRKNVEFNRFIDIYEVSSCGFNWFSILMRFNKMARSCYNGNKKMKRMVKSLTQKMNKELKVWIAS